MSLKPCIVCGEVSDKSRCAEHRPKETRDRRARGYTDAWQQLSRRARRLQPFCTDCGATEDLQGDHSVEAWERHEAGKPVRLQDIDVVCGPCNRRRGTARPPAGQPDPCPGAPTGSLPPPAGKAKFGLLTEGIT